MISVQPCHVAGWLSRRSNSRPHRYSSLVRPHILTCVLLHDILQPCDSPNKSAKHAEQSTTLTGQKRLTHDGSSDSFVSIGTRLANRGLPSDFGVQSVGNTLGREIDDGIVPPSNRCLIPHRPRRVVLLSVWMPRMKISPCRRTHLKSTLAYVARTGKTTCHSNSLSRHAERSSS